MSQPDVSAHLAQVNTIIESLRHKPGPLLPILHAIQAQLGYVPEDTVTPIANALNLSRAEVHGVITFYHHFSLKPRGNHIVEVCRAESCQAMGGRDIEASIKAKLGIDYHQTTQDGEITLEPVYCLGNCACSPSMRIGQNIYGRLDSDSAAELVDELYTQPAEVQ